MSEMVQRVARAQFANAFRDDPGPFDAFELLTDDEQSRWFQAARVAIEAMKYVDGTDEGRLIKVSTAERVEAVSLSLAWDALIDEALNPTPDPPPPRAGLSAALEGLFREMGVSVVDITPTPGEVITFPGRRP